MIGVSSREGPLRVVSVDRELESRTVFASWNRVKRAVPAGAGAPRRDHDAARWLLERLLPEVGLQQAAPVVVVTGSKGKGEIAARAAAHLSAAGVRTGLVSSPGILSNLDRFALDGRIMDSAQYHQGLRLIERVQRDMVLDEGAYLAPTGVFTVLGHALLAQAGAEVVVHEAGLGGAHDEVSLFDPVAVGFGSVFAEHLEVIGPGLAEVAREKFGLIHSAAPVISVPQDPRIAPILITRAQEQGAQLQWTGPTEDFAEANRQAGHLLARAAVVGIRGTGRTGARALDQMPEQISLCRPGRGSVHRTPAGQQVMIDASIDPVGLGRSLATFRARYGVDPLVWLSVPVTKDLSGMLDRLRREGVRHRLVLLDAEHLDYRLPPQQCAGVPVWGQEQFMEALRTGEVGSSSEADAPALITGTISFGSAVLRAVGARLERLYSVPPSAPADGLSAGVLSGR